MPDRLSFNDPLNVLAVPLGVTTLTGAVDIDYATNTVTSGSLSFTAVGALSAQTYTSFTVSQTGTNSTTGAPIYTLTGSTGLTRISIVYTGQTPTAMTATVSLLATGVPLASGTGPVVSTPVCFVAGTMIATPAGEVAVETLRVGDLVTTADGRHRAVAWVGSRTIRCDQHANPRDVMPVRIAAGAFGPDLPREDLLVSPGHALCVAVMDEVLIPASALVNGATITTVECDEVSYWHVELDSHDILLANGLPAESYIDVGNRAFFAAGHGGPDADRAARPMTDYCRPYLGSGTVVAAVRERLRARAMDAGWRLETPGLLGLSIETDAGTIRPDVDGLSARFVLPAGAGDAWLVSDASIPRGVGDGEDSRTLGVCIRHMTIDDGLQARRDIAPDDARLDAGFHPSEQSHRWTMGRARLPASLWHGCKGHVFLRVELVNLELQRWIAPKTARPAVLKLVDRHSLADLVRAA